MACNLIRQENGEIHEVFTDQGQPSILYNQINDVLKNKEAAYSTYLEIKYKAENGQLNSLGNFVPKNRQGEPNPSLNPALMSIITKASENISEYVYKTRVLENEYKKELLDESLTDFLNTINVSVHVLDQLRDKDGNKIDSVATADLLNKVINISKNKKGEDTLSEEAAHFFVELLRADNNPLYKSMYNLIENYQEYKEISDPDNFYYEQYDGNIDKLKREAIAKVISSHILKNETVLNTKEVNKPKLSRLQRWWEKVLNFLNKLLGRVSTNPFLKSSHIILNNRLDDVLKSNVDSLRLPNEIFFQQTTETSLTPLEKLERDNLLFKPTLVDVEGNPYFQKLSENGEKQIERYIYTGPTTEEFTTGDVITKRMSDKSTLAYRRRDYVPYDSEVEAYNKAWAKMRQSAGKRVHEVMERLINSYAGNSNETIATIQNEYTEYNPQQFLKLSTYANNLIKQINTLNSRINKEEETTGKATIRTEMFLMNRKETMGGTMDVIAFFNDGSAAIFDYKSKMIDLSKSGAYINKQGKVVLQRDLWIENADIYNLQMGHYKQTLLKEYGVTKVRQSRIIPILLQYKTDSNGFPLNTTNDLQIGVEDNPFLEQLPAAREQTFIKNIDKLIMKETRRLDMLLEKQRRAKYTEKKRLESKIKVSRRILQRLQLDQNVDLVITEADRLVKRVQKGLQTEEKILKNGEENINYLDETELLDVLNELKHFNEFTAIQDLVQVYEKRGETTKAEELKTRLQIIGYDVSNLITSLKEKMVERLVDITEKEGIKGIDTFNRKIGWTTGDWVSRSNQSHPALRFIHKLKSAAENKLIKVEKELAAEISELQEALSEWGDQNGYPGASVYDALINQDTMSLHTKFNNQFTIDRKKALANRDLNWIKTLNSYLWVKIEELIT